VRARGRLGFFAGLFPSAGGEVGPMAGHRKRLLPAVGQHLLVHVPAAAPVGGALLVHGVALDETLHLDSDEGGRETLF